MHYELTPAAGRAVASAARASGGANAEVGAAALLLGLLAEEECRAALILDRCGVDATVVTAKWPDLHSGRPREPSHPADTAPTPPPLSPEVEQAIHEAAGRLREYADPGPLATEHLLLGLVAAEGPVGAWLRERGLKPESLQAEIEARYGHEPGPLPADFDGGSELGGEAVQAEVADGTWDSPRSVGLSGDTRGDRQSTPLTEGGVARTAAMRAFDAAANRAREGLRVVEDYVRFALDDRHLTGLCKQMRHDLAAAVARVSPEHRLAARDTLADVGTTLATPSEQRRASPEAVLAANLTRLQESLRSLEEFGKLLDPEMAASMERLRYRSYTLHRAVEITRTSLDRLRDARFYVLVDGRSSPAEFERLARGLVEAGVHVHGVWSRPGSTCSSSATKSLPTANCSPGLGYCGKSPPAAPRCSS